MALTLGTNCGFVTTAPTTDPGGLATTIDDRSVVLRDTTPAGVNKITEVGWWSDNTSEEANYEVGLYASDGATVPGEAGTLIAVSRTNAKGTTAGWKKVTVDWTISASTVYWIAVQCDNTATTTRFDFTTTGGAGMDLLTGQTTLNDPYGGGGIGYSSYLAGFYAVVQAETGLNLKINIGDAWKEVDSMKINIGDSWKDVAGIKINIGDSWKTV